MDELREKARALLANNRRSAVLNGKTYTYTVPSPKTYPFQWFWDSCFHAMAYAALGETEYAKQELASLLAWQRNDGFVPHVIFWDRSKVRRAPWHWNWQESKGTWTFLPFVPKPETTTQMQPPVLAETLAKVYEATRDRAWLAQILPRVNRYYAYLLAVRDPDSDGLISIVVPFESGTDYSPAYDTIFGFIKKPSRITLAVIPRLVSIENKLRHGHDIARVLKKGRFHVEDMLVNSIFARNLEVLAQLNQEAGLADHEQWRTASLRITKALVEKCYDAERAAFFNLSGRDEKRFPVLTVHSLMPIIVPHLPRPIAQTVIERHLLNEKEFWASYPVPSVAMTEPTFSADPPMIGKLDFIWRGGMWMNINAMLAAALRMWGFHAPADELVRKSRSVVLREGFFEHFNPLTGKGHGAESFGWSTLVVTM